MNVSFSSYFNRQLKKIKEPDVLERVYECIIQVETAENLSQIHQLKKMSGFKDAYRIKIGNYRIGVFIDGNHVTFAAIAHRKDIYNLFP